jgi:hypothetical protein
MAFLVAVATVRAVGGDFQPSALICEYDTCPNDIPEDEDFELVGLGAGKRQIWCLKHKDERQD